MMENITVTPEVERQNTNCCGETYEIQRIDINSRPSILLLNREKNILYGYIYNNEDRA
jgi:hypothetical protein